ncbi:hypothetical protein I317_03243 [Kwoniella heveanensis CBS 569]|nr:hypothetical protein I317_03243 [Kwoniella heveanensis CBS 569]
MEMDIPLIGLEDSKCPPSADDIKVNIGRSLHPKKKFKLSSDSPVFTPSTSLNHRMTPSTIGQDFLSLPQADRNEKQVQQKGEAERTPFTIVGPDVPLYIELSSSEGSSNGTTNPLPPTPMKVGPNRYPTQTNAQIGNESALTPMHNNAPIQDNMPSPVSEPFDWLAFSGPIRELQRSPLNERGSSWDSASWSDDTEANTPIIITPELSGSTRRLEITIGQLTSILEQDGAPRGPYTPGSSPVSVEESRIRRVSKSPDLSAIASVSTPSTPFMTPAALPPSPRSRSQSAPGRPVKFSATLGDALEPNEDEITEDQPSVQETACAACGRQVEINLAKKMIPCQEIVCPSCFSSTLSAVSVTNSHSQCPACLKKVVTFEKIKDLSFMASTGPAASKENLIIKRFGQYPIPVTKSSAGPPIIMRIDNVAWDVTPYIVEKFLPSKTLNQTALQAIHIPINRFDGRTKDYLYIEVDSVEAGQLILKTKQNTFMAGGPITGGKRRPVTITPVSHNELLSELRPHSSQELHSLLQLCQASLGPPTPATRFLKSRHGAFHALMSVMSKLAGKMSPIYWDLFHVASGAIAILAQTIYRQTHQPYYRTPIQPIAVATAADTHRFGPQHSPHASILSSASAGVPKDSATLEDYQVKDDQAVLDKLLEIFSKCFGMVPRTH